ncbi:MAG: bifunctional 4-hydroxy-2-oxoglutarate aldolase/2-dehydro-3-deoxy-phosphogluconate aldolase [Xanthomonadales bacterium]
MSGAAIERRLARAPVVPLVAPADAETGIRTARALVDGGLTVVEVVLRTPVAIECLGEIAQAVPEAIVGAGTVLGEKQAAAVLDRGAQFLVLPGLYEPVVRMAHDAGVPVYPGIATASEAQQAWNLGLRALKFFPASLAGGTAMIAALGAVFRDVRFMPTGGVSAANLADYLALPNVLACGGSWLTPAAAIAAGRFEAVTALAREAVTIARAARA